jgi:hypothetical protein
VGVLLLIPKDPITRDVAAVLDTSAPYRPRASTALRSDDLCDIVLSTWILALASTLT